MDNDRYYQLGSYDKLFNQIDELTDALAIRDEEVATLKNDVNVLRKLAKKFDLTIDGSLSKEHAAWKREVNEAISATKRHDRS